ncbi:hypothetical protein F5H01DRAFT_341063 [Linnemannia elongata]|nr:hypothetical protein F5H01DRAFT_341063 [Linnemannia elongata]
MQKNKSTNKHKHKRLLFLSFALAFVSYLPPSSYATESGSAFTPQGFLVVPGLSTQEGSIGMLTWTCFTRHDMKRDIGRDGSQDLKPSPSHFASSPWALNIFRGFWSRHSVKKKGR